MRTRKAKGSAPPKGFQTDETETRAFLTIDCKSACLTTRFSAVSMLHHEPTGSDLPRTVPRLTDDEGTFLALLVRMQPATAYQLSKVYTESPVSNFGVSKGKIYPLIRRLKERQLLRSQPVEDLRGTERLAVTALGREAVRNWVLDIRPNHLLLEDPLRTKVQSFELLSGEEQLEWIAAAEAGLQEKLAEVRDYAETVTVPYKRQVVDNSVGAIRARIAWLKRVRKTLTN